jgi:GPH family glycoside/pentoside/hexuronide:cation symporter
MSKELSEEKGQTKPEDKVPVREKAAYGVSVIADNLPNYIPNYLSQQIFVFSLGMSASLVTLVTALFRIFDGFTDPVIGHWSDNFRSRWGRRKPFIVVGTVATAVALPLCFLFPRDWGDYSIMGWFLVFGCLFYFASSLYQVPVNSLGIELTPDHHERTSVQAYRSVVAKLQLIFGAWIWYFTQLPIFHNPETGQADTLHGVIWMCFIISGITLLIGFIPAIVCKERYYKTASAEGKSKFWKSFKQTLRCKPFFVLLIMLIFLNMPNLTNVMGAYLTTFMIFEGVQKTPAFLMGMGSTISMGLSIAAIPFISWLTRRFGKDVILRFIVLFNLPVSIAYWFIYAYVTKETAWMTILPTFLYAPLVAGFWLIVPSMLADVVDHDEISSGHRREGSFISVFSWFLKVSAVVMVGLSGPLIDLVGFDPELLGNQADGVFFRMRILLVAVPVASILFQLWVLYKYPITAEVAHKNRQILEERRGAINQ